jgi:surface antigen
MRTIAAIAAFWIAASGIADAQASSAAFKDTPVARLNAEDLSLMKAKVLQALVSAPGSPESQWTNAATKASGRVTPLDRHVWKEMQCRHVRIANTWSGQTAEGVYRFCEQAAGRWKLTGLASSRP